MKNKALVVVSTTVIITGGGAFLARSSPEIIQLIRIIFEPPPQPPLEFALPAPEPRGPVENPVGEVLKNYCRGYELADLACKAQDVLTAAGPNMKLKEIHYSARLSGLSTGVRRVERFRSFVNAAHDCVAVQGQQTEAPQPVGTVAENYLKPDEKVGDLLEVSKTACGCADALKAMVCE